MRFLSLDDHEPGVIAIGGAPIGIIAIGGMPVGVIAIGFGAVGGVAVSCGGAVGLVALSCGIGVGGYAGTVGLSLGIRSSSVGGEVSVLPDDDDPFPRAVPTPATPHAETSKLVVPIEDIGAKVPSGWAIVHPTRPSEYKPWAVKVEGEPVAIAAYASTTLNTWDGESGPVLAHVTSAAAAPHGEGGGYRDTAPARYALSIDEIVLPSEPKAPIENINLFARQAWWIGKLVGKGIAWLACMAVGLAVVMAKFADLDMTRKVSTSWTGKIAHAEGMVFPSDTMCLVQTAMRSDGKSNLRMNVSISCGSLELYPSNTPRCSATETPVPGAPGHFTYYLSCTDNGEAPSEDHSGRPSLDLSTREGRAVLTQKLPQPFKVEIAIDPVSKEQVGEPLFLGNLPEGGLPPASNQNVPSATPSGAPSSLR